MLSMKNIDILAIQERIEAILPTLNEYQSRRYLSAEAKSIGYGGISLISRLSGMSRQTLTEGVKELCLKAEAVSLAEDVNPPGKRSPVYWKRLKI